MQERFPLGFWNYQPIEKKTAEEVKLWANCGMTLTMSPNYTPSPENKERMLAILDECERQNIRLILCDRRLEWGGAAADPEGYRARFREALADFGAHPAVYGFHIGDEPARWAMDDVAAAIRIQREEDASHVPFVNFLPTWDGEYAGYEDINACFDDIASRVPLKMICYDRYSQMNPEEEGTEAYFTDLRRYAALSARMQVPFWTTLLCVGHFRYRVPSEDDLRWQLSTALASGCSGILFFMFYLSAPHSNYRLAPVDMFGETTPTYDALRRVLRSFNALYADTFRRLTLTGCYHLGRTWGGYPSFADGIDANVLHAETVCGIDGIVSFYHDENGKKYLALTNNSKTESGQIAVQIQKSRGRLKRVGPSMDGADVLTHFHDEGLRDEGETYTYFTWLAPGELHLYYFEEENISE